MGRKTLYEKSYRSSPIEEYQKMKSILQALQSGQLIEMGVYRGGDTIEEELTPVYFKEVVEKEHGPFIRFWEKSWRLSGKRGKNKYSFLEDCTAELPFIVITSIHISG